MSDTPNPLPKSAPIATPRNYGAPLFLIVLVGAVLWAALQGWSGIFGLAAKVYVALTLVTIIHMLGSALFARLLGAQVEEIALGMGFIALSKQIRGVTWSLRSIPGGSFVRMAGMGDDGVVGGHGFKSLPGSNRVLILAGGCLSLLLFAMIGIGVHVTTHSFVSTYPQLLDIFLFPLSRGQVTLSSLAESARNATWSALIACAGAKMAAYNLLPIPVLNGGAILMEMFRGKIPKEYFWKITAVGFVILLLLFLATIIAIVSFISHSIGHNPG